MEFTVKFATESGHAIEAAGRQIGIWDVNRIRNEADAHVPLDRIEGETWGLLRDPKIKINEDFARMSDRFRHQHSIIVKVPRGSLTRFAEERVELERNSETGEILSAKIANELNEEHLLTSWANDGFPLDWNPDAELNTEEE